MTHFASAADYTSPQTAEQLAYFHEICDALRAAGIRAPHLHTSSTNAIGYGRTEGWHTLVRAGHALYGYVSPARGDAPAATARRQAGAHLESQAAGRQRYSRRRAGGLWRQFPRAAAHAHRDPRRGVRRRHVSPPVESRQGHRRRQAHPHPGHRLDGPDHHRPQPHHGARSGRRSHPAGHAKARLASTRSRSPRSPAPSPTTFLCSISARVRRVYV